MNVGLSRNLSLLLGGIINAMFFIGSLFPTFYLDRFGRRKPMMWGSLGLGISMMLISILLSFQSHGGTVAKATSTASVTFFFTVSTPKKITPRRVAPWLIGRHQYMLIFGMTANCIPWVYVPEILPLHVRTKGTAVGISSNWLWNFFVVMVTPTLINNLKWKAYLIFMCTNLAFIPLIYFCYPETNKLTLEEIDWLFLEKDAIKTSLLVAERGWSENSEWARHRKSVDKAVDPETARIEHSSDNEKIVTTPSYA